MEMGQPLTRYALIKDDTGVCRWFVWTVHHALYDGWSLPLIIDAVNRVYRGDMLEPGPHFKTFIKYIGTARRWRRWQITGEKRWSTATVHHSQPSRRLCSSQWQIRVMEHQIPWPRERSLDITTST